MALPRSSHIDRFPRLWMLMMRQLCSRNRENRIMNSNLVGFPPRNSFSIFSSKAFGSSCSFVLMQKRGTFVTRESWSAPLSLDRWMSRTLQKTFDHFSLFVLNSFHFIECKVSHQSWLSGLVAFATRAPQKSTPVPAGQCKIFLWYRCED